MGKPAVRSSHRLVIPALLVLASCGGTPPQSTAEYRQQIAAHRRGRVERWTVADSPAAVSERLRYAFMTCFDVSFRSCGGGGYQSYSCSTTIYHPRAIEESSTRRTLSLQSEVPGALGPSRRAPPGGVYNLLVDVEPDPTGTLLTYYAGNHRYFDQFLLAIARWSNALEQPLDCPDFEGGFLDLGRSDVPPMSSAPAGSPAPAAPTAPASPEPAR